MALTKISTGMLKQDAASSDLNIDAGTLYLDVSNNRVGINKTSPNQTLHVNGMSQFDNTMLFGSRGRISWGSMGGGTGFGIRAASGNALSLGSNGAWDKAIIDTSGNLLVATTLSYGDRLNINGTGHFTGNLTLSRQTNDSGSTGLIFEKTRNTSVNGNTLVQPGDQLGYVAFRGNDGDQFLDGAYILAFVDSSPANNDMPTNLQFWTTGDGNSSPTERMRIAQDGRVGIGLGGANPSYMLHVDGGSNPAARFEQNSSSVQIGEFSSGAVIWMDGSNGDLSGSDYFGIHALSTTDLSFSADGGEIRMTMKNDGKLGIGITAPSKQLTVSGADAEFLLSRTGSYADTINMGMPSGVPTIVGGTDLAFGGTGTWTEHMRIKADGKIGIGTPSPATQLQVAGTGILTLGISGVNGTITSPHSLILKSVGSGEVLRYYQGSAEVFGVYASGKAGIGTASPLGKLHVRDGSAQSGISHTFIYDGSAISVEATEPAIQLMAEDSGTHGGSLLWRYGNNAFAAIANPTTDAIDFTYGVTTANDFQVHSGTNMSSYKKIMSIGADGNVGIGTASPSARLDVVANSTVWAGEFTQSNTSNGDGLLVQVGSTASADYALSVRTNGGNNSVLAAKADGNVGIGTFTTQPWAKLEVAGTAGAQTGAKQALYVRAATATANEGVGIRMSAASGSHEAVGIIGMVNNASGNAGSMTFHTYNLGATMPERMRIDNTGNVGIGTNNPTTDVTKFGSGATGLSVAGGQPTVAVRATSNAQYVGYFGQVATNTYLGALGGGDLLIQTGTGGTEKMRITAGGRVGIGQTPLANNFALQVTGLGGGSNDARAVYLKGHGNHTSIGSTGPTLVLQNTNSTANNIVKLSFESASSGETVSINAINTAHGTHYGDMAFNTRGSAGYSEKLRITSNGEIRVQNQTLVDSANTNHIMIFPNNKGISIGTAYTYGEFNANNGDVYIRANSYPANTGSESKIYLQTANSSGGQSSDVVIKAGKVGIGITAPYFPLHVQGPTGFNGEAKNNILAFDTASATTGTGGGIAFGGYTNGTGGDLYHFGNIQGIKENSTAGNTAAAMIFSTRANGGTPLEQMRIDSAGNVGIGTNAPGALLDLETAGNTADGTYYSTMTINNTGSSTYSGVRFDRSGSARWRVGIMPDDIFQIAKLYNGVADDTFVINSSGNVGIGTTPTGAKLNVNGAVFISPDTAGKDTIRLTTNAGNDGRILIKSNTTTTVDIQANGVSYLNGGNVGIGTTGPANTLDLGAATQGRALTFAKYSNVFSEYSNGSLWLASNFYGTAGASGYKTGSTGNFGAAGVRVHGTGGGSNSGIIQFYADANASKTVDDAFTPTERVRINNSGSAGAATLQVFNSRSDAFNHVQENLVAGLTDGETVYLGIGRTNATKNTGYLGYTWASDASNNNYIHLSHWGANSLFRVYGNGDYSFAGSNVSDRDKKENIKEVSGTSLDKITQIPIKSFKMKATLKEGNELRHQKTGFIAQEVQSHLPDVVTGTDGKGDMGIDTTGLIAHLVRAVKEQQVIIDDLKIEIQQLRQRVAQLEE